MISFIKCTNTGKANLCIGCRIIQTVTGQEQKEAPWSAGRCLFFILNSDCQLQQVRLQCLNWCSGFLRGSEVENLPGIREMHGDAYSIPGSGRSPGGGHSNPLQYSCLENPTDRGVWQATVHSVTKSWTQLKPLSTLTYLSLACYPSIRNLKNKKLCPYLTIQGQVFTWILSCVYQACISTKT